MAHPDPYLSLVVTSRNDNHGGTLLRRMQTFVNALIGQCKRHGLCAELVIVEWNPPADRPPLAEALHWPADTGPCQVRIIEVPRELHARYKFAKELPLYQMIAKNVGIRRARGQFVVATNIDILLSDELMQYLARGGLKRHRMYRIDRHDAMTDVPVDAPVEEQLAYCRTHLLRLNARDGTFHLTPDGRPTLGPNDIASPEAGVVFGRAWYGVERNPQGEVFRWVGDDAVMLVQSPMGRSRALCLEIEPGPGVRSEPFDLRILNEEGLTVARGRVEGRRLIHLALPLERGRAHGFRFLTTGGGELLAGDPRIMNFRVFRCFWSWPVRSVAPPVAEAPPGYNLTVRFPSLYALVRWSRTGRVLRAAWERWAPESLRRVHKPLALLGKPGAGRVPPIHLHTNGCGDFTLMAREHWFELGAYPELDAFSLHLDSLFCFMAHHGGVVEEVLTDPMRIYHIEHSAGSGWTPEGADKLMERITAKGIACLDTQEVLDWASDMRQHDRAATFNGPDWGLAGEQLPETLIPGARTGTLRQAS